MEAFFRLDSDTACDEPNAQQSKAQGVFKDAKKKKVNKSGFGTRLKIHRLLLGHFGVFH